MNEFARQLDAVVRYSTSHPAELTALMNGVYQHQDEYLPRAVLADWLEENPHYAHDPEVDIPMLRQGHDGEPLLHVLPYSLPTGKIQTRPADEALAIKGRLVEAKMRRSVASGLLSGRELDDAYDYVDEANRAAVSGDFRGILRRSVGRSHTYSPELATTARILHAIDNRHPEPPTEQ